MKRLAPNVRTSLANDASRATIRWSLASLARLNLRDGDDDDANTDATRSNNTTAKKTKGGIVKSHVAETLLREVQIRLASQHEKCLNLLGQAEHIMDDPWSSSTSSSKQPGQTNDGGEKKRIVRAINQSWKTDPTSYERSKLERNRAYDRLGDIEVLHADTYQLTHQLLSSSSSDEQVPPSPLFQNFTPANQSLLFSTFESIRSRHASTVEDMADIVIGLRQSQRLLRQYDPTCNVACGLDRTLIDGFLRGRLGVQLLCDHYVGLHRGKRYGGISVNCDLSDVVDDAMTEARHVCDANLGIAPEIVVTWHSSDSDGDGGEGVSGIAGADSWMVVPPPSLFQELMSSSSSLDAVPPPTVTLVRPWVHHALVEVLKNATASSVRREVERMANSSGGGGSTASGALQPSPVYVRILDHPSHVRICVFDQGVGLSSDDQHKAFLFAESSSGKRWDRLEEQQSYAMVRSPLGSLGVGLPLSKMMVQMFGGDVMLRNRSSAGGGLDSGCTTVVALSKDENVTERTEEELVPVHHDGFEGTVGDEADRSLA